MRRAKGGTKSLRSSNPASSDYGEPIKFNPSRCRALHFPVFFLFVRGSWRGAATALVCFSPGDRPHPGPGDCARHPFSPKRRRSQKAQAGVGARPPAAPGMARPLPQLPWRFRSPLPGVCKVPTGTPRPQTGFRAAHPSLELCPLLTLFSPLSGAVKPFPSSRKGGDPQSAPTQG